MSDATKEALEDAIAAHFSDEFDGALVHGYLLQVAGASVDDYELNRDAVLRETPESQSVITSLGLAQFSLLSLKTEAANGQRYEADDE